MYENVAIVTGSGGLVGVESVKLFSKYFDLIIGIDNNSREYFFGIEGSVSKNLQTISQEIENYDHYSIDIKDKASLDRLFEKYKNKIKLIINAAAQPSHDWSGKYPLEDFKINALGTVNLLEMMRSECISKHRKKTRASSFIKLIARQNKAKFELLRFIVSQDKHIEGNIRAILDYIKPNKQQGRRRANHVQPSSRIHTC